MKKSASLIVFLVVGLLAAIPLALLQLGGGVTFLVDFAIAYGATWTYEQVFLKPVKRS